CASRPGRARAPTPQRLPRPGRSSSPPGAVPEAEATEEGVRVVAEPGSRWELLELRGASTADHDLVRLERGTERRDDVQPGLPPALPAVALEPPDADIILERVPFLVREVSELHRLEDAVNDERRAEAGSEPEAEHAAASIAAERLHRGGVDGPHGPAEGAAAGEARPAAAEVVRLGKHVPVDDRSGIADGDLAVGPVGRQTLHGGHHAPGRHRRSGVDPAMVALPRRQDLHVRPADVDDQD